MSYKHYEWKKPDEATTTDEWLWVRQERWHPWEQAHFAGLSDKGVLAWCVGRTSWTRGFAVCFRMAVLADRENPGRVPHKDFLPEGTVGYKGGEELDLC